MEGRERAVTEEAVPGACRSAGAMLRRQRVWSSALSPPSPSICMPLPHLCPSHHHFYHSGNWPTHLLVVGGSGKGSCTTAVYYRWVLLRRSYCPLLPIGGQQKTLQRMLCASRRVCFLCCPACLSQAFLSADFLSDAHGRLSGCDMASILLPRLWNPTSETTPTLTSTTVHPKAVFSPSKTVVIAFSHETAQDFFKTSPHIGVTQLDFQ